MRPITKVRGSLFNLSRSIRKKSLRATIFGRLLLVSVLGASLISGCTRPLPIAFKDAEWSNAESANKEYVVEKLTKWIERSREVRGRLTVEDWALRESIKHPLIVTRVTGWKAIKLEGEKGEWSKKAMGSVESPITIWSRDMVGDEYMADIVICRENRCTDVSAWYTLAQLDKSLGFPDEVEGIVSQDAAGISRVSMVDPWVANYYLKGIDNPVNITVYSKGRKKEYHLKDRVYVKGSRVGGMGREECVGWFDRAEEMEFEDERFAYFCFSESVGVITGSNSKSVLKDFRPFRGSEPAGPVITSDLYGDLTKDTRVFLESMKFVEKSWAKRHTRE